jgi:diaminopimelate epimerase
MPTNLQPQWPRTAINELAAGVLLGHVIECGPYVTGGNFDGFCTIARNITPAFPLAIIDRDGSAVVTKVSPEHGGDITLDMGQPKLACQDIPALGPLDTRIAEYPLVIGDQTWAITAVSMGNPHAVVWVDDLDRTPVHQWGPLLSCHPMFPDRANVEFVQRISPHAVRARVWERGVGETMACGTGACAIVVAGALNECLTRTVTVTLPGGTLLVTWQDNHHVYLTGNARFVFKGRFQLLN